MTRMEAGEMVLQQSQVLDQQVAPALAIAEQPLDLGERGGIDLPTLRMIGPAPPPRPPVDAPVVFCRCIEQKWLPGPRAGACPWQGTGGPHCGRDARVPIKPPLLCASRRYRPCRTQASRGSRRYARRATVSASPRPASPTI